MKLNLKILKIMIFSLVPITFVMLSTNLVKAEKETYSVFAKLPLLGEVQVQNIETNFTISNNEFNYSYNVEPTKLVDFFDNKISNGYIKGKIINKKINPDVYFYRSKKDDFERSIKINYRDGRITDVNIDPIYDISKITNVTNDMIYNSIDPVTMFYLITNFDNVKNCDFTLNIYDGKRRYDLILSNPIEDNNFFSCTITHKKVAGYKPEKIKKNEKYISDLKFIISQSGQYIFQEVSLRDNDIDLIIKKN
mgnify:CR=1 FL=1